LKNRLLSIYKRLEKYYGPQNWWPADTPFEVMIGAILTQNTSWRNVEKAIINLKSAKALSPRRLKHLPGSELARLIKPAGFYNLKAARIRHFIDFLSSEYGMNIKRMASSAHDGLRRKLLGVNGIGPETCDSILLYALGVPVFVVDAYTKRVFSRHGIISKEDDYHGIQALFMRHLPSDAILFNEYHALIVRLAKDFCKKKPLCAACPIRNKYLACK